MGVKEFVDRLRSMIVGPNADYGEISSFYQELERHGAEVW